MDMPDPHFPIKCHPQSFSYYGQALFNIHWHRHIEFLVFTSGSAIIECNSIPHVFQPGDICVVNSNDLHAGFSRAESVNYMTIIADLALLQSQSVDASETKYITPIVNNRILFNNKITGNRPLYDTFMALTQELQAKEAGYELAVKSLLFQIFTQLVRRHISHTVTVSDHKARLRQLGRLTPILQHIDDHFGEDLSVEELADMAKLSRFHFGRIFKELTGKPVNEYINHVRISKAEYWLHNTSMTVSEIAEAAGFADIYYFSRIFKRLRGIPPSEVRRLP